MMSPPALWLQMLMLAGKMIPNGSKPCRWGMGSREPWSLAMYTMNVFSSTKRPYGRAVPMITIIPMSGEE